MISFEEGARCCDRVAMRVLDERLRTMGASDGGLYDFYEARLHQGRIIQDYELAIGRFVLDIPGAPTVVDVGSGIGILACALAVSGRQTVSIEGDGRRVAAQRVLIDGVTEVFPEVSVRLTLQDRVFPGIVIPEGPKLALFTNVAAGQGEEATRAVIRSLKEYDYIVFDALRFFNRYSVSSPNPVLGWFRDEGYDPGSVQIDMGDTGQYYLIKN